MTSWTVTTGDLIIGAEVKYQKPFAGKDENLNLDARVSLSTKTWKPKE